MPDGYQNPDGVRDTMTSIMPDKSMQLLRTVFNIVFYDMCESGFPDPASVSSHAVFDDYVKVRPSHYSNGTSWSPSDVDIPALYDELRTMQGAGLDHDKQDSLLTQWRFESSVLVFDGELSTWCGRAADRMKSNYPVFIK